MAAFFLWCILFVLCWPLAILALIAYPFVWLVLLPFRILGIAVHGALALECDHCSRTAKVPGREEGACGPGTHGG